MKTKTLGLLVLAVVVVVAAVLVVTSRSSSDAESAASSTGAASAGTVIAPDEFSVADYAGKPLVVNMFGSWCPPCNVEAPALGTFAQQNPGVQVVGIACEDTEEDAKEFMAKYGLTYPLVVDDGTWPQEFGITAFPTTIFFDAQGQETDRIVGAATLEQFDASLATTQ